jgi:cyclophilin family peptidyl-prolyl cis-trans isomerase
MPSKKYTSDRKRSRPVTKRRKTDALKKNRLVKSVIIVIIAIAVITAIYFYINSQDSRNPVAVFDTTMGTFKIELYEDKVPITAGNFIDHANNGYYDGVIFHRVIKDFMIQGGDPEGTGGGGHAAKYHEGYGNPNDQETWVIPDEFDESLSNIRGTISMANRGEDTGGSQFFINVVDNTNLDFNKDPLTSKHAVFGMVVDGMDVVDAISNVQTGAGDKPINDVIINSIIIEN